MFENARNAEELDIDNINSVFDKAALNFVGKRKTEELQKKIWEMNNGRARLKGKGKTATPKEWENCRGQRG